MTEEELIKLDFEKIVVLDEESNNGYDYYYFRRQIGGSMFLAADNHNETGELRVFLDDSGLIINDINLVKELIDVFSKIKNAKRKASVSKKNG